MLFIETGIGIAAAVCTTLSYVPQLRKAWSTGETDDISLKMLLTLSVGLLLWIVYGVFRKDLVIIAANGISLALLFCILYFKLKS
jgi:MtN3 and saliva related transmembrane protein